MANEILTPSIIAREALMVLINNMVFGSMIYKDYSQEFVEVGDTITVRKPATFTVNEFDGSGIIVQDAKETGVPVVMDKHLDLSFAITTKDLALNISDFSAQFMTPAMQAYAQDIDARIAKMALDVPYFVGTAGTAPGTVDSITGLRKVMNDNKVPLAGRSLVLDTTADAKLLNLDTFNRVDASGSATALQEAQLGRKFGFDMYFDQNVVEFKNGHTATGAATTSAAISAGATTATITATALTGTIKKGTLFTIAGDSTQHVVTADVTTAGNGATINFYPAVAENLPSGSAITIVADHATNIAFHRNAFAMVSRGLPQPKGIAADCFSTINYAGVGLRVIFGYDMQSKKDVCSIDMICGFKTMIPELAAVLLG